MAPLADAALRRVTGFARRAPGVVLCALVAHGVAYRTIWPADGAHGYFGWYAPVVTALSIVSIVGLPLVAVTALLCGPQTRLARLGAAVVPRNTGSGAGSETVTLASAAFAFLVGQESLEHSLQLHHVALPSFAPANWLVVLAVVACAAYVLGWVGRALSSVVESIRRGGSTTGVRPARARWRLALPEVARRSRPLAVHGALRAPPART
jgi:hypothetical protein